MASIPLSDFSKEDKQLISKSSKQNLKRQSSFLHHPQSKLFDHQGGFSKTSVHHSQTHPFNRRQSATANTNGYVNPAYKNSDDDFSDQADMLDKPDHNSTTSAPKSNEELQNSSANHCHMNTSNLKPENEKLITNKESGSSTPNITAFNQPKTAPEPDEDETAESKWVALSIQWFKVAIILVTFLANIIFSVISKSTILLMTSMVSPDHSVIVCNSEKSFLVTEPLQHDKLYKVEYSTSGGHSSRIAWLWCLTFALIAPYAFSLVRALRIVYFKSAEMCSFATLVIVFTFETLNSIGLSLLAFFLLPQMDVIKGAMIMNSAAALPSFLRLFVVAGDSVVVKENCIKQKAASQVAARSSFLAQLLSISLWTAIGYSERQTFTHWYLLPVALVLISFEWWENYLVPKRMHPCLWRLEKARKNLESKNRARYFVALFTLPWKMLITIGMMVLSQAVGVQNSQASFEVGDLFSNFTSSFNAPTVPVVRIKGETSVLLDTEHHLLYVNFFFWPVVILVGHIVFTYLCYAFSKFTCKVGIHEISFAVPISITVPVTVSLFWALKSLEIENKCQLTDFFEPFQYIFWKMGNMGTLGASFQYTSVSEGGHGWLNILLVAGLWLCLGLASQAAVTMHIWTETNARLAPTEHIFLTPGYNALLLDQSLAMNRRTIKVAIFDPEKKTKKTKTEQEAQGIADIKKKRLEKEQKTKNAEENHFQKQNQTMVKQLESSPQPAALSDQTAEPLHLEPTAKSDPQSEWAKHCNEHGYDVDSIDPRNLDASAKDKTVRIYACTTMWHETQNEMLQTLKSIFRLDEDQRKLDPTSPSYYQLESNIFFDDAFERNKSGRKSTKYRIVNKYVHTLIEALPVAACHVHWQSREIEILRQTPTLVATPYGGRLVWRLPGGSRLVVHLKDKARIRHRKRWSQCMYLYYLLDYRLSARDLTEHQKSAISDNTFILALDGDINFRPVAVHMVVDLMKRSEKLGAVCGRIHPVGSGPIVWYQKFEYSIGHWLQKATEHVFGCVLCSPGCFSLFRARALMDDSVMHKYTTKPSEAIHYVQYDQGEDRWLCTLMLQRGWRIEYCSASDSYTHAPEGFAEIFIQRRRWAPSTMANILDLLSNYRQTVDRNENISLPYIAYQGFLMLGTLLSPGTIFLMVVSAMNSALNLDARLSLLFNLVAVVSFTVVCLKSEDNDLKINFAMLLSLVYALLMLAVLAGIVIDAYKEGSIFSPNSLFFSAMMGSFLLAAILHPQEFACVLPLPLYMLLIPSMYMLLTIYAVTNMNIVAWGTRENEEEEDEKGEDGEEEENEVKENEEEKNEKANEVEKTNEKEKEKEKEDKSKEKENKGKRSLLQQYFDASKTAHTAKSGLITCVCCCSGGSEEIAKNVSEIKIMVEKLASGQSLTVSQDANVSENSSKKNEEIKKEDKTKKKKTIIYEWDLKSEKFGKTFEQKELHRREKSFWESTLAEYLYPLDEDPDEKKRISLALVDLRNRAVFAFAFLNAIFILFVFILQLHKDVFGVNIPIGIAGYNRTFIEETNMWQVETVWLKTRMDPITLCLVVFFGAILVIQLIGMFIHRFGTLAQLLSYTKLTFCQKVAEDDTIQNEINEDITTRL